MYRRRNSEPSARRHHATEDVRVMTPSRTSASKPSGEKVRTGAGALGAGRDGRVGEPEPQSGRVLHQRGDPRKVAVTTSIRSDPSTSAEHVGHGARRSTGEHGIDLGQHGDRDDERTGSSVTASSAAAYQRSRRSWSATTAVVSSTIIARSPSGASRRIVGRVATHRGGRHERRQARSTLPVDELEERLSDQLCLGTPGALGQRFELPLRGRIHVDRRLLHGPASCHMPYMAGDSRVETSRTGAARV